MAITPRKRINISLYIKHEKLLVNKFGKIPSADEILNYLITNNVNEKPIYEINENRNILIELKRIGNNINQIAHYANATKGTIPMLDLKETLIKLNAKIDLIKNDL